ncbi:unnamed protein product [Hermetia illucens]|uniref:Uncharacterized protein n=1 Tax=Hermetia illucens TaxID=343691 RepID=A0A7R8UGA9_HERIL|nr:prothymosin alpha-A-like [Hermetia illucens]CAD7080155.1 unnamed protein product [Hermetia illucens]
MADAAVENKEVPVVEKEVEEVAEKVAAEKPENGTEEAAKENGDSEKPEEEASPAAEEEDDASNGDSKKDEANGDSTDAPAEAVKRKVVGDVSETTEEVSPEKKAKLDDSKEVETNGAESTEVAA